MGSTAEACLDGLNLTQSCSNSRDFLEAVYPYLCSLPREGKSRLNQNHRVYLFYLSLINTQYGQVLAKVVSWNQNNYSFWLSDAIWRHKNWSSLPLQWRVMVIVRRLFGAITKSISDVLLIGPKGISSEIGIELLNFQLKIYVKCRPLCLQSQYENITNKLRPSVVMMPTVSSLIAPWVITTTSGATTGVYSNVHLYCYARQCQGAPFTSIDYL